MFSKDTKQEKPSERIHVAIQLGNDVFSADGPADVVLFMYQEWLNSINGFISDTPDLPAFRGGQPIGRA